MVFYNYLIASYVETIEN